MNSRLFIALPLILMSIALLGCGGVSVSSNNHEAVTGVAQKGGFLKDSQVSFARFSNSGASSTQRLDSFVADNKGNFEANLTWNDWTKISVTGIFYNEFSGEDSTRALTLNSITNLNDAQAGVNVNLFTHLVAARTEYLVNHGGDLAVSNRQASSEIKTLLGLTNSNIGKLDLTTNTRSDNAILLLFSSAFLSSNDQNMFATSLGNLTLDFSDNGALDGVFAADFQSIANYSGKKNVLTPIYNNLIKRGYPSPPSQSTLNELPTWINKNPVVKIEGSELGKTITYGEKITLQGIASDSDGDIASYLWTENNVTKGTDLLVELSDLSLGEHFIQFTATDNKGASSHALIKVTVNATNNKAPIVNAGNDQTIRFGESVTLNGTASDSDGSIVSWKWIKNGISRKSGSGSTILSLAINNLSLGAHQFTLAVTDNMGVTSTDTVLVTVIPVNSQNNQAPVVNAGSDRNIKFGEITTLSGSAYDPDGSIDSWKWKNGNNILISGRGSTLSSYTLRNLSIGTHVFTLEVTDNKNAMAHDTVIITVRTESANQPPIANAGSDKTINVGESVTLRGSGHDSDGSITSWRWMQGGHLLKSGTGSTVASYTISNLAIGKHTFTLEVTDNKNAVARDTVIITVSDGVANLPPTANAGSDKIMVELQALELTGHGSDTDGSIASYQWKEGATTLSSNQTLDLKVLSPGTHHLTLVVTDDDGATGSDELVISVKQLSVNLTNQSICRTKYGYNIQITYNLSGNKTGSGNTKVYLYSNPGCTGAQPTPYGDGPATYSIESVAASGASGRMKITSQGRTSIRSIVIDASTGKVTAIH